MPAPRACARGRGLGAERAAGARHYGHGVSAQSSTRQCACPLYGGHEALLARCTCPWHCGHETCRLAPGSAGPRRSWHIRCLPLDRRAQGTAGVVCLPLARRAQGTANAPGMAVQATVGRLALGSVGRVWHGKRTMSPLAPGLLPGCTTPPPFFFFFFFLASGSRYGRVLLPV